jgi:hypothetical protein
MEMSLEKMVENLLREVNAISEKHNEFAKITGENYNIFKILNAKENDHSRVLANLLNPEGSHDCGSTFLELFFENLREKKKIDVKIDDFSKCKVYREFSIEVKNEKEVKKGRLDIYIVYQNYGVAIENKIYTNDEKNQLDKYKEFLIDTHKENYDLFYLTPDGRKPKSEKSEVKCKLLSYSKDILPWLELCQKEVFNKPLIRETLEQYINLLKIITNQTRSRDMSGEILETLIKSEENVKAAFAIRHCNDEFKERLFNKYLFEPLKKWGKEEGLVIEKDSRFKFFDALFAIDVNKEEWLERKFHIRFQFDYVGLGALGYGIGLCEKNIKDQILVRKLEDNKKKKPDKGEEEWWLFFEYFSGTYKNWDDKIFESELCKEDNNIVEEFKKRINELREIIEG